MRTSGVSRFLPHRTAPRLCTAAALVAALLASQGCSSAPPRAAQAEQGVSSPSSEADEGMPVLILVDTGEKPLGAFDLALRYDPAVVKVTGVTSAGSTMGQAAFPATPMSNPSTFSSGQTPLVGFQTAGAVMTGRIPVAVVRVDAVKTGVSALSVSVKALYDPEGAPIPGTARADPDSVHVK